MKSQRRRPVRPLTIYGFRRALPKVRGIWLALLILASLSVLPRVLSPIAQRLWGTPKQPALSAQAPRPRAATPEDGTAFAGPELEPAVAADTTASIVASDSVASTLAPSPLKSAPFQAPTTRPASAPARSHRPRTFHKKTAAAATPAPNDPAPSRPPPPVSRLVPAPR
jgi:hypothetical protein